MYMYNQKKYIFKVCAWIYAYTRVFIFVSSYMCKYKKSFLP